MNWRTAYALDDYKAAVNARYPNRSRASDGTIGDASHASTGNDSDHNPWITRGGVGVVRAFDLTHDPAHGVDCDHLSDLLFEMGKAGDRRLRNGGYIIFNRLITNADWSGWHAYYGENPHTSHMHISFSTDYFDDRGDWSAAFDPAPAAPRPPAPHQEDIMGPIISAIDGKPYTPEQMLAFIDFHTNKSFEVLNQLNKTLADLPNQIAKAIRSASA